MDVHGAGVVAILGTVGAATGAISAVLVYTICARRRRLLTSGGGPLNWHVFLEFFLLKYNFLFEKVSRVRRIISRKCFLKSDVAMLDKI